MSPEFRAGERDARVESKCIECGCDADAYATCVDGDLCQQCADEECGADTESVRAFDETRAHDPEI